jgi:hydroxymethylbilane synthase
MHVIGSRGSKLALVQSTWVKQQILDRFPETPIEIRIIKTSADRDQRTSLRSGTTTGVFVKEIEDALMAGEIDLAVHSMKDVPTRIPEGLCLEAIPVREDPRDAMLARLPIRDICGLPPGAVVGTGSIRRQAQLLAKRPDLRVKDIRGNVDTRLEKLESGAYDAVILACAGLKRLGLQDRINFPLEMESMLPAPGQGALALQIRKDDRKVARLIANLNHRETAISIGAEREFLRTMGGGCNSPIAVHAWLSKGLLTIVGLVEIGRAHV